MIELWNKKKKKFEPFDESKDYRVAVKKWLARGKDGFTMLDPEEKDNHDVKVLK